jgi:hypothetical protein
MKKLYSIFILTVLFSLFNSSYAIISTPNAALGLNTTKTEAGHPSKVDVKTLTIAEMEAKLGHKLTWKQKLAMKLMKKRGGGDGSFGIGFVLGFFLGLIGVLIAYLAFEDETKTIKGSWWGFGVWAIIVIITVVAVIAAAATV